MRALRSNDTAELSVTSTAIYDTIFIYWNWVPTRWRKSFHLLKKKAKNRTLRSVHSVATKSSRMQKNRTNTQQIMSGVMQDTHILQHSTTISLPHIYAWFFCLFSGPIMFPSWRRLILNTPRSVATISYQRRKENATLRMMPQASRWR
jgi:hypothetical protein